jgi:hypothetical protein
LFGRRVLRCIFGAVQENGIWRKRYNHELYEVCDQPDIVKYITANRLGRAGHVMCMDNNRTVKKVFTARPEGRMQIGRPKLRWDDGVTQDIKAMGMKNWKNLALKREEWLGF